ncbi:MAG: hypothetical protein IJ748_05980 [Bacteroidales bacterium]|nr:hypothetical protein [Bacteroidales bacterium]
MDKERLNQMLAMREDIVSMQDLLAMDRLVKQYPYCSTFWILGTKFAFIVNSFNKNEWLSKTALFVSDREHLKVVIDSALSNLNRLKENRARMQEEKITPEENKQERTEEKKDILSEINSYEEENLSDNPTKEELINRFLKIERPKINTEQKTDGEEDVNIDSALRQSADDEFKHVSETMAKIYLKQGNKDKALKIYQQLMESNPKKSIYFANQIEKIKNS